MSDISNLLERNKKWADSVKQDQADFFDKSAEGQAPQYLWIGCADSRIPVGRITDAMPGEIFVHRNIANMVVASDLNCLSVMQYAVDVLKVKDIVVCGHYGCGGVAASMTDDSHGLIDNWLNHIKNVQRLHEEELSAISDHDAKFNRLCELNVQEQVHNVCNTTIVRDAWARGQELTVHGLIYSLKEGLLKELKTVTA